jgi:hypothetical protein
LNKLFKLEATPNRSRVRRKKRVKLPQRNLTLSVFFVILTLIAAVTVISLQQTQATQTQAETIGTYTSTATYDYTAAVQPSTIYGNKTIIKPQDGTIYTKLASNINLTLSYRFTSTLQNTPKITYNINSTLKTGAWKYQTSTTPKVTTQQATIQIALSSFDKQEIEQTKARIDNETGVSTGFYSNTQSYYALEILPTFQVNAQTNTTVIHQTFQPALVINSTHTTEGDIIKIENLTQTSTGTLTQQVTSTNQNIINQRYASYIFIITSIAGLSYSTTKMVKQQKHAPLDDSSNEKLLEPYKDLIIEATENVDNTTSTIKMASIAELAKAAETLNKPILHIKNESEETLCIIEGTTKYQYTIYLKPPSEPPVEPESNNDVDAGTQSN